MQLNLNNLLEEIYSWKTLLRSKDSEIEIMRNQIVKLSKQNTILEEKHKAMLIEIAEYNELLSSLHSSISKLEDCEVEKKLLESEKNKLEHYIECQTKLHQKEIDDMYTEIEKIKYVCKKEIEAELIDFESKASTKQQSYLNMIKDKDKHICKLEDEISRLKTDKDQDVLKLKIEYEEMMNKMKARLLKTKVSHSCHDDYHKEDIFRQKYMKLEKESREESEQLKTRLRELQSQIDTLKCHNCSPNLTVTQKSTPVKNHQLKEGYGTYDEDYSHRPKRFRSESIDENYITNPKSKLSHIELVKPVKKKLFNLDLNYFNTNTHSTSKMEQSKI